MSFIKDHRYILIKDIIVVTLLLVIFLMLSFVLFSKNKSVVVNQDKNVALVSEQEIKSETKEDNKCLKEEKVIYVDVKGAVKQQGVYLMKEGDIVNDAIKAAGGVTSKGVTKNINLSKKVEDQMVIYVYTNAELNNYKKDKDIDVKENAEKEICDCSTYEISNCEGASIIFGNSTNDNNDNSNEANDSIGTKVNINKASKEELLSLNGIGESKALAIIEYRTINGRFNSVEEIKNVTGIGEALFEKIKDYITV